MSPHAPDWRSRYYRTIFRVALTGLLTGEDREQLAARLRVAADRAYDQFAGGLGEYGKGS